MNFLEQMAAQSTARAQHGEAGMLAACRAAPVPPPLRLARFDLIAEVKRSSPSEGVLAADTDVARRALGYGAAGAAAVSVLTEPTRFGGSLEDLRVVADALRPLDVPAMRKDFLVAPWQVLEARAAGAGGVLLIVAMLEDGVLEEMIATAREHGLFVLLEAFDERDLERAAACAAGHADGPQLLVGVNSRDLRTLAVDPARLARLAPHLPAGVPAVAESGLHVPADAAEAAALGYRLALVGTALMRSAAPDALAAAMLAAGRRAVQAMTG
ncbi:MAG TPA: indole-3-glycerol-phosphate synthase [Gammaproteobacteria bacterium]|nr:indole-3-glycerol-phosphate synthase [Gammaproteobacteria bacterium]